MPSSNPNNPWKIKPKKPKKYKGNHESPAEILLEQIFCDSPMHDFPRHLKIPTNPFIHICPACKRQQHISY